jgi:DNA-binding response OmpR family regulator
MAQEVEMPGKILIVDDDPDIVDAVSMVLESQGYQVTSAGDGVEGLASLKADKPDLMILDLLMPKMDGFAVMKELQDARWSKYRDIPILILTSVREDAARRRYELEMATELNVDDYVEKPISPDILLQRVERLIKRKEKV